jgi:hypothetical protein
MIFIFVGLMTYCYNGVGIFCGQTCVLNTGFLLKFAVLLDYKFYCYRTLIVALIFNRISVFTIINVLFHCLVVVVYFLNEKLYTV